MWLAGTVRDISLGVLEYGREVKNDPAKFIAGYLLNPVKFAFDALTYGEEYSIFEDALETGNAEYMQFALENLHKEQARQKQDLEAWITQIKKMTYEEFCRNIGYGGADFVANYGAWKACGLGLGKSGALIEKFKEFKNSVKAEKALADANKVSAPSQGCFENIAGVMKTAFEKSKEDLLRILGLLENNPELIEVEGSVDDAVARIMEDLEREVPDKEPANFRENEGDLGSGVQPSKSFARMFEERISKMPPEERVAEITIEARKIAQARGWAKAPDSIAKSNRGRQIYLDKNTGILYSVDTQHGRFEVLNDEGKHLGEIDFDFNATKGPDFSGRHDLNMP